MSYNVPGPGLHTPTDAADAADDRYRLRIAAILTNLRYDRPRRRATQVEVAAAYGSTQSHISDIESGVSSNLRLTTLQRLLHVYGYRMEIVLIPDDPDGEPITIHSEGPHL